MPGHGKDNLPNILEYYDWVAAQKFSGPSEHHQYVPKEEQDFLQRVIYPMFYDISIQNQFKTHVPFPLVLKENTRSKDPKYVIDNSHFTIIFFSDYQMYWYEDDADDLYWEVSVHIKDHRFCDKRIKEFKSWYTKSYHGRFVPNRERFVSFGEDAMYPKLNLYEDKVQDFSIRFLGIGMNFMLFKLMDILRLF